MSMTTAKEVRVGVGVLVIQDGKLLLGKRKNAHGEGDWSAPGGHLAFGESPAECAARELLEETGVQAKAISNGPWTNDFFEVENRHYITVFQIVTEFSGQPKVMEPHKSEVWRWFDLNDLPTPLFRPLVNLMAQYPLDSLIPAHV